MKNDRLGTQLVGFVCKPSHLKFDTLVLYLGFHSSVTREALIISPEQFVGERQSNTTGANLVWKFQNQTN